MRLVLALVLALSPLAAAAAPKPPAPVHKQSDLDTLFADLAKAETDEDAQPIRDQILAQFQQSGSPSADLLMTRANTALQAGDSTTARKLLDAITVIEPNFAEAWHARANLQVAAGDDEGALLSLQRTVLLNPREFAALAELGEMLADYGDKPGALKMLRRAFALNPTQQGLDRQVRELTRAVEGDRI
jgi:tetratricopeptide (TPR) repeat protein